MGAKSSFERSNIKQEGNLDSTTSAKKGFWFPKYDSRLMSGAYLCYQSGSYTFERAKSTYRLKTP